MVELQFIERMLIGILCHVDENTIKDDIAEKISARYLLNK